MDPQKEIWRGDPGHKYKLRNNKLEYQDSFTPFVFADPCSLETKQNYPGTLIRFPLRNERSELSDKLYTTAKLKSIFKALKDDASVLLLFLRYVEKIKVFTINTSGFVTKLFSVETDKATERVRKSLKDTFFTQVKQFHSNPSALLPTLQYEVTISVHDIEVGTRTNHQWFITNWVGSKSKQILEASQTVCSLPWLGLAASPTSQCPSRLFCFLPMPDSEEVNPPLPVCVHGTFGLTKDRRHLKWKTSDMQNDNGALWNDLLLSEMFPFCYAKFLNALRDKCDPNKFYSFWPSVSIIKTNWRVALRPLLALLLQDQLFRSQNGSWVKLQSSVYVVPQMNSGQFPQVVINALIKCGKVVVVLDDRVWEAVQFMYANAYPFTLITPSLVRQALKSNSTSYFNMSRVEKFQLLDYCLEDNNYYDLAGLVLLPLVNNTFVAFGTGSMPNKVYACSTKFLQTRLLANNEAVLVNIEEEDGNLHQKLIQVARSDYTQLKTFKVEDFAMLLKQLSPFSNGWCSYGSSGGFYNENWLKTFWSWVSAYSLDYFISIPLLPVCNEKGSNRFRIVALQNKYNSRVIKYNKNANYHPELISATGKLGCHLTCSDEFRFLYHPELNNYVHDLTPSSVLNISSQTAYQNVVFTQEEATALRHFLFQYPVSLNAGQQSVLLCICIFPAMRNNSLYSLQSTRCYIAGKSAAMVMSEPKCLNKYLFCIPQSPLIITCERGYVRNLQSMLPGGSWLPTKLQVILYVILSAIENNRTSKQDLLKFFSIILEPSEYHSLIIEPEGSQLINKLKPFKFIPTRLSQNSGLSLPSETYDPTDHIITGLFAGQNVFPIAPFSDIHFAALRELGMKTSVSLCPPDIIKVTQIICHQSDIQSEIRRANKLLEFLSSYIGSKLLDTYYNRVPFRQTLCSIPWLPVMVDPPKDYPKCLGWEGATGSHFVSVQHLHASSSLEVHRSLPYLIGSQIKILQYEESCTLSPNLLTSFRISQTVPLDAMIKQFLNLISHSKDIERSKYNNCITLLYNSLHVAAINKCYSQYWQLLSHSEVVEVSTGKFVQPSLVACSFDEKSMTVGKLEPYLYILPSYLQQYKELYCHIGAIQQVTMDGVLAVIKKISSNQNKNDLELAIKILKWLCRNFTKTELKHLQSKIFVPVDGNDTTDKLVFKSANQVAFLDKKLQWLKKDTLNDIMEGYYLVHPLCNEIASALQLKPLNTMIGNTEVFCFEQAGQSEPLTTRLKRILKEYKDNSVLQELLQNADDAGATEVAVYYDTREHDSSNLFFPGMANSYGPALLFYNNAEFTEEDFESIRKIAGETKMEKPLKIGRFGVGFCSVYHITDVPSFVSGEYFVVFDPTLQCLKEEIESEFNPGIKLNYCKNCFVKASNQLLPYVGVHGFDHKKPFKGTLFRFPLRFRSSQISKSTWTGDSLLSMITGMKLNAPKLLMFLNNVKKMSFHQLCGNTFKKVFTVTASKTDLAKISKSNLISYEVKYSPRSDEYKEENWIIASNSQQLELTPYCMQDGTASVSVRLKTDVKTQLCCVDAVKGECFCYLPLHVETGLPVHVSGNFAVTTNRRGLWKADNAKTATTESNWNKTIMTTVVFQAYTALLLHLKQMQQERLLEHYRYWDLWPVQLKEAVPWEALLNKFYNSTLSSENPLFYSKVGNWKYLNECKFLSSSILSASFEKELQLAIHKVTDILKLPVVDLTDILWNKIEANDNFKSCVINEVQFLKLFYDDNVLSKVPIKCRSIIIKASLIVYANKQHDAMLPQLLQSTKCIPCCPDGIKFKKPQDIVDSESEIAVLFNSKESMCPHDTFLKQSSLLHQSLVDLGMMKSLSWKMIIDRARSLQEIVQSQEEKVTYLNILVSCIKENLNKSSVPTIADKSALQKIKFLPVMQKPADYLLNWKGNSILFSCGPKLTKHVDSLISINAIYACGSQIFILDTNIISSKFLTKEVLDFLGIRKQLESSDVFHHFTALIEWFHNIPVKMQDKNVLVFTNDVIAQIYAYWGRNIASKRLTAESLSNLIQNELCIWNGTQFLHPSTVAFKWPTDGPFLYKLPAQVPLSMQPVMKHLGIQDEFSTDVLVVTLRKMKQQYNDMVLPSNSQEIVNLILPKITNMVPDNVEIFLPDENFVLRRAKQLKYNDAPWCTLQEDYLYCHVSVSRETALSVGVEPVRNILLQDFEITQDDLSEDFGQEEKLTQRLNNILRDYPKDITFIKEILQNADDAGATQLYFILDKRHHSEKEVISEAWKLLQGPALLVWNNSTFNKEDFEGIQRLGLGSKSDDANKIGHYGIGFSVVYHFTDCPSFVTDNKLCILDPHYHYIAHKKLKPGKMYKNFNELHKKFPSMKSPYLLNDHGNIAQEIKRKGTLFRLPLRLTQEMVTISDFTNDTMSLEKLESDLMEWISQVTEALLFLKHINDVRFFVINKGESSRFELRIQEKSIVTGEKITVEKLGNAKLILYPMTLFSKGNKHSDWLVQLGEGNVKDQEFNWNEVKPPNITIWPQHGIAVPVNVKNFEAKSFCYLPLPGETHLPIHIHGHFILHSDRRGHWVSSSSSIKSSVRRTNTNSDVCTTASDPKAVWNELLLKAISVSYAHFLISNRNVAPGKKEMLEKALNKFYTLFPSLNMCNTEPWFTFAKQLYITLGSINAPILAKLIEHDDPDVNTDNQTFVIRWYELCKPNSPDECFIPSYLSNDLYNALTSIGMNIIDTPYRVREQFKKVDKNLELPEVSNKSVLKYYSQFYYLIYNQNSLPCPLSLTKFENFYNFIAILDYLLQHDWLIVNENETTRSESIIMKDFSTLGLLVTADGNLHSLTDSKHVISSFFWNLFPKSLQNFVHDTLLEYYPFDSDYLLFNDCKSKEQLKCISSVISKNIPPSWNLTTQAPFEYIKTEWIKNLFDCLENDPVFCEYYSDILMKFPLLPATNNMMYSASSRLLPLKTVFKDEKSVNQDIDIVKKLMTKLEIPLFRHDILNAFKETIKVQLPSVLNAEKILESLYLIKNLSTGVFQTLDNSDLTVLFGILKQVSYSVSTYQNYIKSLPIFTTIDQKLVDLDLHYTSRAWIWNDREVCTAGIDKWIPSGDVFLSPSAPWACLKHEAENLQIGNIDKYDVYCKYIFPKFHLLNRTAQLCQLRFIKDNIYLECKFLLEEWYVNINAKAKADLFVNRFKSLQCIPDSSGDLCTIDSFYDHNEMLFKAFCQEEYFLPSEFRTTEWLDFLKYFGLKSIPSKDEFVTFCKMLSKCDDISAVKDASATLLEVLFYVPPLHVHENKYREIHSFPCLEEVSQIPIAIVEDVPELNSIKAQKLGGHVRVMNYSNSTFSLAKLSGSSLIENKYLVWTIRPLIKLDYDEYSPVCMNRLRDLNVILKPSVEDVVSNLKNLSTTELASYSRFAGEGLTDSDSRLLPEVVVAMLQHIQTELLNNKKMSFKEACDQLQHHNLSNTKILPVKLHTEHYTLVMPIQVLNIKSPGMDFYYPFLHPLIEKANDVVHFLSNIGVQKTYSFSHIQYILRLARSRFQENEVDSITQSIIIKATQELVKLLQHAQPNDDIVQYLQPLYLLSEGSVLTECSKLVINDISGKHKLLLPSGYAYLHSLGESQLESALLYFLPKQLGLISLRSVITYEMIDNEATERNNVFSCISNIEEIIKSSEFLQALLLFSNCCTHGTTPDSVNDILTNFQSNLTVQYLNTVHVKPYLEIGDSVIPVSDTVSYSFFLQKTTDQKWTLCLKNTRTAYSFLILLQLAKQICSKLKLKSTGYFDITDNDDLPDLATFVGLLLQCDSISSIASVTKEYLPGAHDQLEVIASDDPLCNSIPDAHLFDLEEWIGDVNEQGKEAVSCKQMLQKVASTFMKWNESEPQIDLNEAKIWIQQAQYDHSSLCTLMGAKQQHFASVCFMCHQVAEKSLKAGLYAKCGLKDIGLHTHNLIYLANELKEMGVRTINGYEVANLNTLYLPTRYPNCHNPSAVPGDKFSTQKAEQAFDEATRILEAMQKMIDDASY